MRYQESIAESTESKGGSPFWMLAGMLFIILVVVLGGMLLSRSGSATENEDADRAAVRAKNLAELETTDASILNSYGWIDKAKGTVHIPIAKAMELIIPMLNAKMVQPTATPK